MRRDRVSRLLDLIIKLNGAVVEVDRARGGQRERLCAGHVAAIIPNIINQLGRGNS